MSMITENCWGGLIEVMYTDFKETEIPNKIKKLKRKLECLELSKNLQDIRDRLVFTLDERNYLNSPLLDEIYKTIFSENPGNLALRSSCFLAYKFYKEREVKITVTGDMVSTIFSQDNIEAMKEIMISYKIITYDHLIEVCMKGAIKILRFLFEPKQYENLKLPVNEFPYNLSLETTLLSTSIKYNHIDIVKFLIEKGGDVNHRSTLMIYPQKPSMKMLEILLQNGLVIDTELIIKYSNCLEYTKFLLERGRDNDIDMQQVFMNALTYYNTGIMELLLKEKRDRIDLQSALLRAIDYSYYEILRFLLDNGAEVTDEVRNHAMNNRTREVLGIPRV